MKRCINRYCKKPAAKKRRKCHRCRKRAWRARNPMKSAYARLRDKARARKILFTISLQYFSRFARQTEYLTRTGNKAGSLTVDRKNNLLGYVPGNIQALTRSENSVKLWKQDERRMKVGFAWRAAA